MLHNEELYEQIERYLNRESSKEEQQLFEQRMQKDKALAELVHLHRDMAAAVSQKEDVAFSKQLEHWGDKYFLDKKETKQATSTKAKIVDMSRRKMLMQIAAAVLFLSVLTYSIWTVISSPKMSNQDLFADAFTAALVLEQDRSGQFDIDSLLKLAYQAYDNKNYVLAISNFEEVIKRGNTSIKPVYYKGAAHLGVKPPQTELAKPLFLQVIDKRDTAFVTGAKWYLALAYLQENRVEESKILLQGLLENKGNKYAKKAKRLLLEL